MLWMTEKNQSLPVNSVDSCKALVSFSPNSPDQAQKTVEMPKNGEFLVKEDSRNVEDEQKEVDVVQCSADWADSLITDTTTDSDSFGGDWVVASENVPCYSDLVQWSPIEAKPIVSFEPESSHQRYEDTRPVMSAVPVENNQNLNVGAGLHNLGNTCFLNAVLQSIMHTIALLQLFAFHNHEAPCYGCWRGFCLFSAFRELIELALFSNNGSVSPWKLVDNLSYFSSSFTRYQQEDAHEFLQHFLDGLERCCPNIVTQVFGGRLVSKLRCCNCGHCSNTYEPLIDVSLEIKDVDSLTAALESFTSVEKIKYSCERCKGQVSFEKQLMLDKAPAVAAFHLKRFANTGSFVQKVDKQISFPMELDLLPYTDNSQNNNEEMKYDLYAVIVHAGASSSSGHYYSYIRSAPNEWYKFDDSQVVQVYGDFVLTEEAYIMFYAKRGTMWFSDLIGLQKHLVDQPIIDTSTQSVVDNVNATSITSPKLELNKLEGNESKETVQTSITFADQVSSEDQLQMDLEQDLEMKHACTLINKRIPGSRGEELMDALRGSESESSLNEKRRKLQVSPSRDFRWSR